MDSTNSQFLVQKWRSAFIFFDANNDGILDEADMSVIADYVSKKTGATEEQAEKSRQEWVQWIRLLQPDTSLPLDKDSCVRGFANLYKDIENLKRLVRGSINNLFDRVDLDGDGLINQEELDIFYSAVGRTDKALTKNAFDQIDRDGDGFITREELVEDAVRHYCNPDPVEGKAYFYLNLKE